MLQFLGNQSALKSLEYIRQCHQNRKAKSEKDYFTILEFNLIGLLNVVHPLFLFHSRFRNSDLEPDGTIVLFLLFNFESGLPLLYALTHRSSRRTPRKFSPM